MTVRERIHKALLEIEEGGYSGNVLRKYAKEPTPLSKQDRKLLWEVVLGVLKWKFRIDYALSKLVKRYRKLDERVKILLRSGYYQIHFLDRIPFYSAVNESVNVAKIHLPTKYVKFTNAVLRKATRSPFPVLNKEGNLISTLSTFFSYPEFLIERWLDQFGVDSVVKLLRKMNSQSPFTLWINTYYTDLNSVRKFLREEYPTIDIKPYGILQREMIEVLSPIDIGELSLFKDGLITPQDPASCFVTKVLEPKEGEVVLDACSAPGIKTAQIALAMNNRGRVVAYEVDQERFENLLYNVKRLGAVIVEAKRQDVIKGIEEFEDGYFDRILVDAPCSDLGTIGRRPEIRYRRTLDDIRSFSEKQRSILKAVYRKLKRGGVLVYSVCSFEREETIEVYDYAIRELGLEPYPFGDILKDYGIDGYLGGDGYVYLLPHISGSDGFFIAKFRRR